MKWKLPFSTQSKEMEFKSKYNNFLPIEYLWLLENFWNTKEFDKLSTPMRDNFKKLLWEFEYNLGINDKPCLRCGSKPQWGEYYCDDCKNKEDHANYMLIAQRMHEDKYFIKDRMKLKDMLQHYIKYGKRK